MSENSCNLYNPEYLRKFQNFQNLKNSSESACPISQGTKISFFAIYRYKAIFYHDIIVVPNFFWDFGTDIFKLSDILVPF